MSNEESRSRTRDPQGPQGTQRISPDQISELLQEATQKAGTAPGKVRLIGIGETVSGQNFPLRGNRITIGRSPVCDIHIDEPSLSSEHARLERTKYGWKIVNLLSTNGVFVNGKKGFSHWLKDGDTLGLGQLRMRFEDPDSRGDAPAPRARRALLWGAAAVLLAAAAVAAAYWLEIF